MKLRYLTLLVACTASLMVAPPAVLAQPPGEYGAGYEEEFSERAGVDEEGEDEFEPGAPDQEYESDTLFPDDEFDYAEQEYGEREYGADYYDYSPYFDEGSSYGYDSLYTDDWFRDESGFDSWYDAR